MVSIKRLLLIGTGGTIASSKSPQGLVPVYGPDELLKYVEHPLCNIDTFQILNLDSTNMQPNHWLEIAKTIEKNYENYDGFVITHGTDTMAYTASMLSYILQDSSKPIVVTGSQKPIDAEGTDARRNLTDSIGFACEKIGGVFVVFNGNVINGNRAVKVRTKSNNAFDSINYPIVATIRSGKINFHPDYSLPQEDRSLKFFPSIATDVLLIKLTPGLAPDIFDYIHEHYRGVVVESFGTGGVPFLGESNLLSKIENLVQSGIMVVVTTQCLLEGGNLDLYQVGRKILENRILPAYDMTTEAALTKLMWALGQAQDFETVRKLFLTPIDHDLDFDIRTFEKVEP